MEMKANLSIKRAVFIAKLKIKFNTDYVTKNWTPTCPARPVAPEDGTGVAPEDGIGACPVGQFDGEPLNL